MLKLTNQLTWVDWQEAGIRLRLAPLTVRLRQRLVEEATDYEADDKQRRRGRLNLERFHALIAKHCLHDWEGVVNDDGYALDCREDLKIQFLDLEPANLFVFSQIQGLGLHLGTEAKAAGNG